MQDPDTLRASRLLLEYGRLYNDEDEPGSNDFTGDACAALSLSPLASSACLAQADSVFRPRLARTGRSSRGGTGPSSSGSQPPSRARITPRLASSFPHALASRRIFYICHSSDASLSSHRIWTPGLVSRRRARQPRRRKASAFHLCASSAAPPASDVVAPRSKRGGNESWWQVVHKRQSCTTKGIHKRGERGEGRETGRPAPVPLAQVRSELRLSLIHI